MGRIQFGSDAIKSVSVDNSKVLFKVTTELEHGVYTLKASPAIGQSGIYNNTRDLHWWL